MRSAAEQGLIEDFAPAWVEFLCGALQVPAYLEHGLWFALATAARDCLSDTVATCVCLQAAMKQRSAQAIVLYAMDLEPHLGRELPIDAARQAFLHEPAWQPARRYLERLAATPDWAEVLFAANLCFEPIGGHAGPPRARHPGGGRQRRHRHPGPGPRRDPGVGVGAGLDGGAGAVPARRPRPRRAQSRGLGPAGSRLAARRRSRPRRRWRPWASRRASTRRGPTGASAPTPARCWPRPGCRSAARWWGTSRADPARRSAGPRGPRPRAASPARRALAGQPAGQQPTPTSDDGSYDYVGSSWPRAPRATPSRGSWLAATASRCIEQPSFWDIRARDRLVIPL